MGLLARLGGQQALDVNDERLWTTYSAPALTGVSVTTETALRLSTAWACGRLISSSLASIPLIVYRKTSDDGRQRATNHPLYDLLHYAPNEYQTAFEFKRLMTMYALFRGNGLAFIRPGPRGPVDSLIPIHPNRYMPPETVQGRMRYPIRAETGVGIDHYWAEEIFHLCGLTFDGMWGMSVIEYARESMGLAIATESYGARFFSQNASPAGILVHPGKVNREGRQRIKAEWDADMSGLTNAHRTAVLAEGIEWKAVGINHQDAQFLETRTFQIADIARWFGVDLTLLQENTKSTSWGTGIEQMLLAFKTFTLLPWAKLWEGAISRDLIMAPQVYFAEYLFDALVQPDLKTRYEAYDLAVKGGWKSRNEVRRLENDNPVQGLDVYDRPLNVGNAAKPPAPAPSPTPAPPGSQPGGGAAEGGGEPRPYEGHYAQLLEEAAGRVVRKELAAMRKAAARCHGDAAAWEQAVREFYSDHALYVSQTMRLGESLAATYVQRHEDALIRLGCAGFESWLIGEPDVLVVMVKNQEILDD